MMATKGDTLVQRLPIGSIDVVQPRAHDPVPLRELVASIARDGLHRPVTVRRGARVGRAPRYQLVCGSRRLAACLRLGETTIPAIVVDRSATDAALLRLAENLGRRDAADVARWREVAGWQRRRRSVDEIADLTGLEPALVTRFVALATAGRWNLRQAVDEERIDVAQALRLVAASTAEVRLALQLLQSREEQQRGPGAAEPPRRRYRHWEYSATPVARERLLAEASEEQARLEALLARGAEAEQRLAELRQAVERLFDDPEFVRLLEEEGRTSLPAVLCLPESMEG